MGKGDSRRRSQVPYAQFDANWDAAFSRESRLPEQQDIESDEPEHVHLPRKTPLEKLRKYTRTRKT